MTSFVCPLSKEELLPISLAFTHIYFIEICCCSRYANEKGELARGQWSYWNPGRQAHGHCRSWQNILQEAGYKKNHLNFTKKGNANFYAGPIYETDVEVYRKRRKIALFDQSPRGDIQWMELIGHPWITFFFPKMRQCQRRQSVIDCFLDYLEKENIRASFLLHFCCSHYRRRPVPKQLSTHLVSQPILLRAFCIFSPFLHTANKINWWWKFASFETIRALYQRNSGCSILRHSWRTSNEPVFGTWKKTYLERESHPKWDAKAANEKEVAANMAAAAVIGCRLIPSCSFVRIFVVHTQRGSGTTMFAADRCLSFCFTVSFSRFSVSPYYLNNSLLLSGTWKIGNIRCNKHWPDRSC